jgi:hypothetical protein
VNLFGLDWLAMCGTILALILLGRRSRWGFVSFIAANLAWIICGLMMHNVPIVLGNLLFLGLNFRGFRAWRPEAHDANGRATRLIRQ